MEKNELKKKILSELNVRSLNSLVSYNYIHGNDPQIGIYRKKDVYVKPAKNISEFKKYGNSWEVKGSMFIEVSQNGSVAGKGNNYKYGSNLVSIAKSLENVRDYLKI